MLTNLLLLSTLLAPATDWVLQDRVAAFVNDRIITMTEVDLAIQIYPVFRRNDESEGEFYTRVLWDLIHQRLVAAEYGGEFTPDERDYEAVQTAIITKAGSLERLLALLAQFDMDWNDLRQFISDRVLTDKVVREKFSLKITVTFAEIETFYQEEYLPPQRAIGSEPQSLVAMAPVIEQYLRQQRALEKLADWFQDLVAGAQVEIKMRSPE